MKLTERDLQLAGCKPLKESDELTNDERLSMISDMIDGGLIDSRSVVDMCMAYMSEDDVKGMMMANDILDDEG